MKMHTDLMIYHLQTAKSHMKNHLGWNMESKILEDLISHIMTKVEESVNE